MREGWGGEGGGGSQGVRSKTLCYSSCFNCVCFSAMTSVWRASFLLVGKVGLSFTLLVGRVFTVHCSPTLPVHTHHRGSDTASAPSPWTRPAGLTPPHELGDFLYNCQ